MLEDPRMMENLFRHGRLFDSMESNPIQRTMRSRFKEHVGRFPKREDHQLGTGGKIFGALLSGLTGLTSGAGAGIGMAQNIRNRPYAEAVEDFEGEAKFLGQDAQEESEQEKAQRQYDEDLRELDFKQRKEGREIREGEDLKQHRQNQHELDMARTDIQMEFGRSREERERLGDVEDVRHNKAMEGISRTRANRPTSSFNPDSPIIATYVRKAEQDVMNDMAGESGRYSKFILRDKNGYVVGVNAPEAQKDPEGYKVFQKERDRRTRLRLNTPRFAKPQDDLNSGSDFIFEP